MFGSSLPAVVCRRAHVLFTLFVFFFAHSGFQHIFFSSSCVHYDSSFSGMFFFEFPFGYYNAYLIFFFSIVMLQPLILSSKYVDGHNLYQLILFIGNINIYIMPSIVYLLNVFFSWIVISRSGKEWNTLFLFIMRAPPTK